MYEYYTSQFTATGNIEAETRLPPFRQRYFQIHFVEWKYINYDEDSIEDFFKGPINNIPAFFLYNSLAPARRQAII